jgi:outer membrane lipoprotein LolB
MFHPLTLLRHCLAALLLLLWAAGCAMQKPTDISGVPDLILQKQLTATAQWQFTGKLAVRTPTQSESARIQWQQDRGRFDIHLSGPAGLKATRIYGVPGDVNFEQGEHHFSAESVETLSEQLVGWPLPATELGWWLRGLPAPGSHVEAVGYTVEGWLSSLIQNGWTLQLSDQHALGRLVLPGRIEAQQGDTRVILVIKDWQVR